MNGRYYVRYVGKTSAYYRKGSFYTVFIQDQGFLGLILFFEQLRVYRVKQGLVKIKKHRSYLDESTLKKDFVIIKKMS